MTLTVQQVADFLSRHADTHAVVAEFEDQVRTHGYTAQSGDSWYQWWTWAIKEDGIVVPDSLYGNVLILPNAKGLLIYTGSVSSVIAIQVNKPEFHTDDESILSNIQDATVDALAKVPSLPEVTFWGIPVKWIVLGAVGLYAAGLGIQALALVKKRP